MFDSFAAMTIARWETQQPSRRQAPASLDPLVGDLNVPSMVASRKAADRRRGSWMLRLSESAPALHTVIAQLNQRARHAH